MEAMIWIYVIVVLVFMGIVSYFVCEWASGRRDRIRYGHDRLVWALGAVLDDVEDGEIATTSERGNVTIAYAREVWRDEFNRVDK